MGFINVAAMVSSYTLASRMISEPEVAALIVIAVAVLIFVIGNFIILGFNQIAEANRLKSEFIAIVSHQLRSPLSVFKWAIEAMAHNPPPPPSQAPDSSYLAVLRENAEKMIQLVNLLLEASRIEAGRLALRREQVRLDVLTEGILRSFSAYARASNITLDYVSPANVAAAAGDREKVKMVIQNLIDNAIRYSSGGGRVAVSVAPFDSSFLEWKVRDSGMGIPREEQRYIFQKFFRAGQAISRQTEGSGLGLYIARSLITAMGGRIGFESQEGQGSAFWFRLPIYRS